MIQSIQIGAYQFAFLIALSDTWRLSEGVEMQRFEAFFGKIPSGRRTNADY
jgi:hypothetical protein